MKAVEQAQFDSDMEEAEIVANRKSLVLENNIEATFGADLLADVVKADGTCVLHQKRHKPQLIMTMNF